MTDYRSVEVRIFKWPKRPRSLAPVRYLGEVEYGLWLGNVKGDPWSTADGSQTGIYIHSGISVNPPGEYWSACFNPSDPVVDVDIILPTRCEDGILEIVDLELDILRLADGTVEVRDQEKYAQMKEAWNLPDNIAAQAEATFEHIRKMVERYEEPFGEVGRLWLTQFMTEYGLTD